MRTACIVFLWSFAFSICVISQELPRLDPELKAELAEYIRTHHQSPEEYVVSKFKDHDVVFIGENHFIKHDPELIQRLIPLVCTAGVYSLGFEFARRIEQSLVDSLLDGPTYDEQLARLITFRGDVHWGFQEYIDIYKSAWHFNNSQPKGARKFRILGLGNSPDWSVVKTQDDRDKPDVKRKVWHGESEEDWAEVILDSVVAKGEKALVYCGAHHAFTEYRQPIVDGHKFIRFDPDARIGNHVFNKIGKRAVTILLHAPWVNANGYDKPRVYPADGYIDAVMEQRDPKDRRFGFDTRGTPFGKLPGETSLYKFGYNEFSLEMICDGYIYQGPFSNYEGVSAIKDFVNVNNLEFARAKSGNPAFRRATIEDFYRSALEAGNVQKRLPKHR